MRQVAGEFAPGKPCHVLNDPFDKLDQATLGRRLEEKAAKARADRRIDVLWFGNGDNPVFPVGLTDLAAYAGAAIAQSDPMKTSVESFKMGLAAFVVPFIRHSPSGVPSDVRFA
jgi:hypothetical protein